MRLLVFVVFIAVMLAIFYLQRELAKGGPGRPQTPEWPQWDLLTDGMAETVYERKLFRLSLLSAGGLGSEVTLQVMSKGRWSIVSSEYYDSARIAQSEYSRIWQLLPDAIEEGGTK